MVVGKKIASALEKGPSKGALTRVSPGVYRDAAGALTTQKGRPLTPQGQPMQGDMRQILNQAMDQRGQQMPPNPNMPMNQMTPEQSQWLAGAPGFGPGNLPPYMMQQNPTSQVQTPDGQAYRFGNRSGINWNDVQNGIAGGGLRNFAQMQREGPPQVTPEMKQMGEEAMKALREGKSKFGAMIPYAMPARRR